MRKSPEGFVNSRQLQLALREWRRHLLHPLTLIALAAVTAVLALVGPFGTIAQLSLPERAAYWGFLVVFGYVAGYLISYKLLPSTLQGVSRAARVLVAGTLTGVAMSLVVVALNRIVFGVVPDVDGLPGFLGTVLAISIVLMSVIDVFVKELGKPAASKASTHEMPPILDRVSLNRRGPLVALSVEDHYVRVRTTNGEDMVLMRLADAIRETGDTPGAQVHRSHWAAFDHVVRVKKLGDRAVLEMQTGSEIPVSRSNMHKLKEAGLLP